MKKLIAPILMTLSLFMFSCQPEALDVAVEEESTAQEYLDYYVQNPIIFQVAQLDSRANVVTGYFITKSSELHSFSIPAADFKQDETVYKGYLETLMASSTGVVGKVNADELQEMYRFNLLSGRTTAKVSATDETAPLRILTSSFVLRSQYTTWTDLTTQCPVHHNPLGNSSLYLNVELRSEMARTAQNTGQYVGKIVNWLDEQFELANIEISDN